MKLDCRSINKVKLGGIGVFSFFNIYIYMIQNNLLTCRFDYVILLFNVVMLSAVIWAMLRIIEFFMLNKNIHFIDSKPIIETSDKEYCLKVFGIQLVCWTPVFLAYYPGLFTYDVAAQIPQQIGSYTTHHPLLHTIYLQFFYYVIGEKVFRNYNTGIAIATIVQTIIFSAMLVYVHLFLKRIGVSAGIRYFFIAFTSISPIFSLLGISMTKDIFFSGSVALVVTSLAYFAVLQQYSSRRIIIAYILGIIGTILFRNNGIYAVVALTVALIIKALKKPKTGNLLMHTVLGLFVGVVISVALEQGLQASKGSLNEALSLPYQQIACAYMENKEQFAEEDAKMVKEILPEVENYRAEVSDPIKGSGNGMACFNEFLKLYLKLFVKYPESYVKAFCLLDAGYLSITDISFAEIQGIYLTSTKEGFEVYHMSIFPPLEKIYEKLYTENKYENVIVLNLLCSPALYFWILIGAMLNIASKRRSELLTMQIFMLVFLLTIFAGPCALSRYALPYIICVPIYLACAYYKITAKEVTDL